MLYKVEDPVLISCVYFLTISRDRDYDTRLIRPVERHPVYLYKVSFYLSIAHHLEFVPISILFTLRHLYLGHNYMCIYLCC